MNGRKGVRDHCRPWALLLLIVAARPASSEENRGASLELPTITIYGPEMLESPIAGEKTALLNDHSFPISHSPLPRTAATLRKFHARAIKAIQAEPQRPHKVRVAFGQVDGGSHALAGLTAQRRWLGKRLTVAGEVAFHRTDGHLDRADWRRGTGHLELAAPLSSRTFLTFDLDANDDHRGAWGAPTVDPLDREVHRLSALLHVEGSARLAHRFGLAANAKVVDASDKGIPVDVDEHILGAEAFARARQGPFVLEGHAGILRDVIDTTGAGDDSPATTFLRGAFLAHLRISGALELRGGVRGWRVESDFEPQRTETFGIGGLRWTLSQHLEVGLAYEPELRLSTLDERRAQNPWLALTWQPTSEKADQVLSGYVRVRSAERLHLRLGVRHEEVERFHVWDGPDTFGLWLTHASYGVEMLTASARANLKLGGGFRVQGEAKAISAEFRNCPDAGEDVPYMPDWRGWAQLSGPLRGGLEATVRVEAVGKRLASDQTTTLEAFSPLEIALWRKVGPHLVVELRGRNLLNEDYEVWQGYREVDRTAALGVRVTL